MPKTKKSTKSTKSYPEGPAGSYLPGLPASVVADQARTMKASAGGPRYKILKDGSGISTVTKTPLNQKKEMKKSPLKQTTGPGSKPKDSTNIEKTTDYSRSQKSIAAGISNNKGKFGGTTKNPKTGVQESDAYVPKYVKGKGNTPDQVVSNGKVIRKSVTAEMKEKTNPAYYNYRSGKPQTKEDLYTGYKADSTATMSGRNKSANYVNIRTGAKQNLTEADKKELIGRGLAKKTPLKQVSALSGKKDKSTVAPKTVAAGIARRSPILMKKKC